MAIYDPNCGGFYATVDIIFDSPEKIPWPKTLGSRFDNRFSGDINEMIVSPKIGQQH
jgi:hypothetical protein